mmetsp:Transcript_18064/g.41092  ORF Transcript_18064/g.41092 Transcript_18064/m.41092 type:complete len:266 (+) Transcript_18064:231-1028(+)
MSLDSEMFLSSWIKKIKPRHHLILAQILLSAPSLRPWKEWRAKSWQELLPGATISDSHRKSPLAPPPSDTTPPYPPSPALHRSTTPRSAAATRAAPARPATTRSPSASWRRVRSRSSPARGRRARTPERERRRPLRHPRISTPARPWRRPPGRNGRARRRASRRVPSSVRGGRGRTDRRRRRPGTIPPRRSAGRPRSAALFWFGWSPPSAPVRRRSSRIRPRRCPPPSGGIRRSLAFRKVFPRRERRGGGAIHPSGRECGDRICS